MMILVTTSIDNERILFSAWKDEVSTALSFTPEEARDAIRQIKRELERVEEIARWQDLRDAADKALTELAA